jgi:hypothetical protein
MLLSVPRFEVTPERRRRNPGHSGHLRREHPDAVDVAPSPLFAGLERPDDRVTRGIRVPRGMAVRRVVAATDVPALQADAQVKPAIAGREALLATIDGLGELEELDVSAVAAENHGNSVDQSSRFATSHGRAI